MVDDVFKNRLIDFIKTNGYECIYDDVIIAVRKEGKTKFIIKIEDVKPPSESYKSINDIIDNYKL